MSESRHLSLLHQREKELETCGYCPKLCRAACPVSNAEPRDTLTPWGKMSLCWFAERGDVPADAAHASVAWACTGCHNCRENCDHNNPVADTLADARGDFFAAGVAPGAVLRSVERQRERDAELQAGLDALRELPGVDARSPRALLVGCAYVRNLPDEARDAVTAVARLAGDVRLVDGCCGLPLLAAGDRNGFEAARGRLERSIAGAQELFVVDPGCAMTFRDKKPTLLVDLAVRHLGRLARLPALEGKKLRWHDPCQLGRGLGHYEEPRAVLGRLLGHAPEEFARRRGDAACSGAGGLLPVSMPDVSQAIAADRISEHEAQGGGSIVTACASSLERLRSSGADAIDLVSLIRQSLEAHG